MCARNTPRTLHPSDRWPERVIALFAEWKCAQGDDQRNRIISKVWELINVAIVEYVHLHARVLGRVDNDDAYDIASEKTIAFLRSLRTGAPDIAALRPGQLCRYVSALARNGLVDVLRRGGSGNFVGVASEAALAPESDGAEINVGRGQFLDAIRDCVSRLPPRTRRVWFMRLFLDMPSKRIAAQSSIGMTTSAVDMLLSRTRRTLRECMKRKGLGADDAPPGALAALWESLRDPRTRADHRG